jgi:hypothetical protein
MIHDYMILPPEADQSLNDPSSPRWDTMALTYGDGIVNRFDLDSPQ